MNKIICKVCGTSYPETANRCPICGSVRSTDENPVDTDAAADSGYTYVKGGRFSKSNVRRRNRGTVRASEPAPEKESGSKGLVITAVILMLAIIAVVAFVVVRFFFPAGLFTPGNKPDPTVQMVACTGIELDVDTVTLKNEGDAKMIYARTTPENTTDTVTYTSADISVAKVNEQGKIVAVGSGTTTITVSCGSASATMTVICEFAGTDATEDPTEETTEATEESTAATENTDFRLNRVDITFNTKGDSWVLYDGSIPLNNITWSSDNESIATFENGKVVAVGKGTTNVHAEYNGTKVSCIIRCNFAGSINTEIIGSGGGIGEDTGNTGGTGTGYALYSYGMQVDDVTIKVGESFTLTLKDSSVNTVSATWATTDASVCSANGSTFTGVAAGTTSVTATYDGVTYTCIVRVI